MGVRLKTHVDMLFGDSDLLLEFLSGAPPCGCPHKSMCIYALFPHLFAKTEFLILQ